MSNEKKIVEQQLPGWNFSSGNTTLFAIAESHGKNLGSQQSIPADAIVEDKNKDILDKAIPADKIESVLKQKKYEKQVEAVLFNGTVDHINKKYPPMIGSDLDNPLRLPISRIKVPITRGQVMLHTPTKQKVKVLIPNYDIAKNNRVRHQVKSLTTKIVAVVPEDKLEML